MKKQHANILLGIIGVVALLAILVVGGGAWFFFSAVHRASADQQGAAAAFDEVRARFNGVTPLIELRPGGPALTRALPPPAAAGSRLRSMHFIGWSADEQRLTRIDIPMALVRLRDASIDLVNEMRPGGDPMQTVVSIRTSDIERAGSTLLFDQDMPNGQHVLIWTD